MNTNENPATKGLVADYSDGNLGYYIQYIPGDGYRYISYEAGEDDEYGNFYTTQIEAVKAAVQDWRTYGQGDNWDDWSKRMAKDAVTPQSPLDQKDKFRAILMERVGEVISSELVEELSEELAKRMVIIHQS